MQDLTARLEAAAVSLAGSGPIKDRLIDAYCRHLADVHESDLPGELGSAFGEMIQALHRAPALPPDTVVRASVRKLSIEQARGYAALVIRLYGTLASMQHRIAGARGPWVVPAASRASALAEAPQANQA